MHSLIYNRTLAPPFAILHSRSRIAPWVFSRPASALGSHDTHSQIERARQVSESLFTTPHLRRRQAHKSSRFSETQNTSEMDFLLNVLKDQPLLLHALLQQPTQPRAAAQLSSDAMPRHTRHQRPRTSQRPPIAAVHKKVEQTRLKSNKSSSNQHQTRSQRHTGRDSSDGSVPQASEFRASEPISNISVSPFEGSSPSTQQINAPAAPAPSSEPPAAEARPEAVLEHSFFDAVAQGKISLVKAFLTRKNGADPNAQKSYNDRRLLIRGSHCYPNNTYGWRPLHFAAWCNDAALAQLLLDHGADPLLLTNRHQTPLHVAVRNDAVDVAQLLLDHMMSISEEAKMQLINMPNPLRRNQTALQFCAVVDADKTAEVLTKEGADLGAHCDNPTGPTDALGLAFRNLSHRVTQVLLPRIDPASLTTEETERAFVRSAINQSNEIVEILRPRIKRPKVFLELMVRALDQDDLPAAKNWLSFAKATISTLFLGEGRWRYDTAWHVAARKENQEMLQFCYDIDSGSSVDTLNGTYESALAIAARAGAIATVETLLRFGASPATLQAQAYSYSLTEASNCFHMMVSQDESDVILDERHVEILNKMLSAPKLKQKGLNYLLPLGHKGYNVVHLAAMNGQTDMLRAIGQVLSREPSSNGVAREDSRGLSPLMLAASRGKESCVSMLLNEMKADLEQQSSQRESWRAIHFAAAAGHEGTVSMLASAGADVNAETSIGETAVSLAQKSGYSGVVSILKNHGAAVPDSIASAASTGSAKLSVMHFHDTVPPHLNYPADVRSLNNDSGSDHSSASATTTTAATSRVATSHQSANVPWRTARLFISSTFEDMHAERNYLVKFILPRLKKACTARRIHLVEVDLRWGVTAEESQSGRALEICLSQVDQSHIFTALIGNRYGWVPSKAEVPDDVRMRYDWQDGYSVTHMEIFRAALRSQLGKPTAIFIREGSESLAAAMPSAQLKAAFDETDAGKKSKVAQLKQDLLQRFKPFKYQAKFKGLDSEGKPQLDGLDAFGEKFYDQVWSCIQQQFPVDESSEETDELIIEQKYHNEYIEQKTKSFMGRQAQLHSLEAYLNSSSQHVPLLVTGDPGSGKSALMSYFVKNQRDSGPVSLSVVSHFVGASPLSTNSRQMLWHICGSIARECGLFTPVDEGADYDGLEATFKELLVEFSKSHASSKLLVVIEAVNQLDSSTSSKAHELTWVPLILPKNVKIIVSTLPNSLAAKVLESRKVPQLHVGPLSDHDRAEIVTATLAKYNKKLDDSQMRLLLAKTDAAKPLFLTAACEELRVFGVFEKLTQKVKDMPALIYTLIESIVKRVSSDIGAKDVTTALALLFVSRSGLLETELSELLSANSARISSILLSLELFFRRVGKEQQLDFAHRQFAKATAKMFFDAGNDGASVKLGYQKSLAKYYYDKYSKSIGFVPGVTNGAEPEPRAVQFLAYALISAKLSKEAEEILTSLNYLRRRCALGQVYELVSEFQASFEAFGDSWSTKVRAFASFIQSNVYLFATQHELIVQQGLNAGGPVKAAVETEIRLNTSKGLKERFIRCVNSPSNDSNAEKSGDSLLIAVDAKTDVNDVCWNPSDAGAQLLSSHRDGSVSLWKCSTGEEIARLSGQHTDRVNAVEFLRPSASIFLSAGADGKLKLFHSASRQLLAEFSSPSALSCADCLVSISEVSLFASGGEDGAIRLYSTNQTAPSRGVDFQSCTIENAHAGGVYAMRLENIDANSTLLASGGFDKQLKVWRLTVGANGQVQHKLLSTFAGAHSKPVRDLKFVNFKGKRYIVSSAQDKTIKVWSTDSTTVALATIDVHGNNVETCDAIVRNGQFLILSGSWDRTVRLFALNTTLTQAQQIASLPHISHFVNAVMFSPDNGNKIAVGSPDHLVRVFSTDAVTAAGMGGAAAGSSATTPNNGLFQVHSKIIRGLAYNPTTKMLATGSWDNTICLLKVTGQTPFVRLEKVKTLTGHTKRVNAIKWVPSSAGESMLASGSMDQLVKVWNTSNGSQLRSFKGHKSTIFTLAVSHDGRYIASGSQDNNIIIWNNGAGSNKISSSNDPIAILEGHTDWVSTLAFSPMSRRLVSGGRDAMLKLWNTETGEELETMRGHTACILDVCYSSDGKWIASAAEDKTARIWDAFSLKCIGVLTGHTNELLCCAFHPTRNDLLITGSSDKTVRWWDCNTHECIWTYFCGAGVMAIDWSDDGKIIFVGDSAGCVHLLDTTNI